MEEKEEIIDWKNLCVICDGILDYEYLKKCIPKYIRKELDFFKFCKKHMQELEDIIKNKEPQAQASQKEVESYGESDNQM